MRLIASGASLKTPSCDRWLIFDGVLVVLGILSNWILPLTSHGSDELSPILVLRVARIFWLVRTVKILVHIKELWILAHGLLNSTNTMLYPLLVLGVIMYAFASLGVELITNHPLATGPEPDAEFQEVVRVHFRPLPVMMMTLIQFLTMDSIGSIYKTLIERDWRPLPFFAMVILVMPIVLMNLITAIVVNSALEQASQDKDARKVHEDTLRKKKISWLLWLPVLSVFFVNAFCLFLLG